jgi:hypothetical protein
MSMRTLRNSGLAVLLVVGGLSVSEKLSFADAWMTHAEAHLGVSPTPLSFAGVAQRTTRRGIVGGAAAYLLYGYWSPYYHRPYLPYGVYWSPRYRRPVCYNPYPPCY